MAAVLHVLLRENLVDHKFLDRYTTGFAPLESHILGEPDGIPKTPAWAEKLCGTSADVIEDFALRYGSTKPAALIPGLSIQRTLGGEEAYRMAFALQAATGNTGVRGGSTGACIWGTLPMPRMPFLRPPDLSNQPSLPIYRWADAVLEGRSGGFPTDIQAIYSAGQNLLNQGSDITKNMSAFEKVDFAISHEIFLTPTARYCDIVLPATTFLEREDALFGAGNYLLYSQKATDPLYESRNDYDIFCDLARRLGFHAEFSEERTAKEWLEYLLGQSEINDVTEFQETGIYVRPEQNRVGFSDFILDPDRNPLTTPSGRIELSSEGCSAEGFPPHPVCRIEGLPREYPLFLITPHSPVRINSTGANLPWTEKLEPTGLHMHPEDAKPRRIKGGDMVRVSSREGQTRVPVILSEDIMPGIVCLPQGRWVSFDENGIDIAGSANVLTSTTPTLPSYGSRTHSVFVQVSRDS
jgi:anaerobic dimethyl sulfoxide reductase subunit A